MTNHKPKGFYDLDPKAQAERLTALATTALAHWDLDSATVELIKHRENAVFRVQHDKNTYALRIHRADYHSDEELNSELLWIQAIDSETLRTPQIIRSKEDALFVHVSSDAVPETRQVDLLEWFEGAPLADIESNTQIESLTETFSAVGRLMALTHNHSASWQPPEGFTRHAWDEQGILGDQPFWGPYWALAELTAEQVERLAAVKQKALTQLAAFGKTEDRYGLIHADFLPENLLRDGDRICLIDFDDAGFGWHLFDIATTLFFHLGEPYFDEAAAALLAGYREQRQLPEKHLEHLPMFFLLRGITYLGWAHTRRETETAKALTPTMVAAVDDMAKEFLS